MACSTSSGSLITKNPLGSPPLFSLESLVPLRGFLDGFGPSQNCKTESYINSGDQHFLRDVSFALWGPSGSFHMHS